MPADPSPERDPDDPLAELGDAWSGMSDLDEIARSFAQLDDAAARGALDDHPWQGDDPSDDDAGGPFPLDGDADDVSREVVRLCHAALELLDAEESEAARDLATEALRLDDEHPFPPFVLGIVAERENDLDTARDLSELALSSARTNADAIGLRAHVHLREHEFEEAERLLRWGIVHNPDDPHLHEGVARVALACGHHDEALRAARTCLRLEPGNSGALAVRSAVLEEVGDRGALLANLRELAQLHPDDPYGLVELAGVEAEHGNLDRARVLLVRAQRLAPRDVDIADVRALVEHVDNLPLLRPVPRLMRWLRDFPGGLAGFCAGWVIAALPMHALAIASPASALPATLVVGAWGAVALYAWVGPAVLTLVLDRRAARRATARVDAACAGPHPPTLDLDSAGEAIVLHLRAREIRAARRLLSRLVEQPGGGDLDHVAARLRRVDARLASMLLSVPGDVRLLTALGTVATVIAPLLERMTGTGVAIWYGVAATSLALAWLLATLERRMTRVGEEEVAAAQLACVARRHTDEDGGPGDDGQLRLVG